MKAVVLTKYGSPLDLEIREVETPLPKDNEVRIKIVATSVNATDFEIIRGDFIVRVGTGLRNPSKWRLGCDFAGRVDAIGKDVTLFKVGDEVYADLMYHSPAYGTFAEYVCVQQNALRIKPVEMTFEQAATIPQAGVLAVQGIRGKSGLEPGQQVLINGAGGGVGTFAIQIAKHYGAEVTAVDTGKKFDLMKSLGADHVMDFTQVDFTKTGEQYDIILDVIGRRGVFAYRRALKPVGEYRMVGGSLGSLLRVAFGGLLVSKFSSKKVGLMIGMPNKREDMDLLTELFETEEVVPVIDKIFPLSEVPEAISYVQRGHSLGKVVISME